MSSLGTQTARRVPGVPDSAPRTASAWYPNQRRDRGEPTEPSVPPHPTAHRPPRD